MTGETVSGRRGVRDAVVRAVRAVHWYLREVTGEADYDRYLERHAGCAGAPMTRREFERRRWEARAADPGSRCC